MLSDRPLRHHTASQGAAIQTSSIGGFWSRINESQLLLSRPQDEESFNSDFAAAFSKLLELGVPRPGMQPIMLPVLPYLFLTLPAFCTIQHGCQLTSWQTHRHLFFLYRP